MHDIHGDFLRRLPQLPSTVRLLLNCFPSLVRLSFNLALCPCTHQLTGVVLGNQFSQFEFEQQARNKGVPGVHPTVISSSELVMDDERLIHIKEVTQHHAVQCFAREPAECSLQLAKPSSKLDNFPG